jgi:hypothetical protein
MITLKVTPDVAEDVLAALENSIAMLESFIEQEEELKAWESPHHTKEGYQRQVEILKQMLTQVQ